MTSLRQLNALIKELYGDLKGLEIRHYNAGGRSEKIKITKQIKPLKKNIAKLEAERQAIWRFEND